MHREQQLDRSERLENLIPITSTLLFVVISNLYLSSWHQ